MGPLSVKFWGTRGLIASPRRTTAAFGGNTPCIQIQYEDQLVVVDTGFGVTNLGDALLSRILAGERLHIHVLYTHFHWDHVQGLPFFKPIYFDQTTLSLHSPVPVETMLDNLNILFDGSYSPFESLMTMPAQINLERLVGPLTLGGLKVEYLPVDHASAAAGDTYAYKFTTPDGNAVCLITDHEAGPTPRNRALVSFAKGVDLLIHDGQYREDEYARHLGWGHSSINRALDNALKIGAPQTLLTHHAPWRDDDELKALRHTFANMGRYRKLAFDFAREDVVYQATRIKPLPRTA